VGCREGVSEGAHSLPSFRAASENRQGHRAIEYGTSVDLHASGKAGLVDWNWENLLGNYFCFLFLLDV